MSILATIDTGDTGWMLTATALVLLMTPALGRFASATWNNVSDGLFFGDAHQLWSQVQAALAAPAYAFVGTYVLLRAIGALMPLRVSEREEGTGLDVAQHGEEAYVQGDGAILISPEAGFAFEGAVEQP